MAVGERASVREHRVELREEVSGVEAARDPLVAGDRAQLADQGVAHECGTAGHVHKALFDGRR